MTQAGSLLSDVDIETRNLRIAAQEMVRKFEWVIPMFQVPVFLVSIFYDPIGPGGQTFDLMLLVLHLLLIGVYFKWGGPFSWGGWWFLLPYAAALIVLPLSLPFMVRGAYGTQVLGVPLFSYSIPYWPFLAFYPWPVRMRSKLIETAKLTLVALYYPYLLLMIYVKNGELHWRNFAAAGLSFMWLAIGYVIGKCFAYMCRKVSERLGELQKMQSKNFFDSLHSDVSASVTTIEFELSSGRITEGEVVAETLKKLKAIIIRARTRLVLEQVDVDLAELASVRVNEFKAAVKLNSHTRVGSMQVRRQLGILINRAIGDLVTNAIKSGAKEVGLNLVRRGRELELKVTDNGPGFPSTVLENESTSLALLSRDVIRERGKFEKQEGPNGIGTTMRVVLPLYAEGVRLP